ncbi:lamin tail domain-containing protein, partial [candidate division WOR-3 bacterium]|nr:lamin tail domain-containing protein [candidate division WOR-3 bacterium]
MRNYLFVFLCLITFLSFLFGEDIAINEIYYTTRTNSNETQWIELFNKTSNEIDISGWKLSTSKDGSSAFDIPAGTVIDPKGFLIFAASRDVMVSLWGLTKNVIEYGDVLIISETGDNIHLFDNTKKEIDAVWFGDGGEMGSTNSAMFVSFGMSLSRNPDGKDTNNPSVDFSQRFSTPGHSNNYTGFSQST